jgi:LysR family carnitine catabolism transcriptional activator
MSISFKQIQSFVVVAESRTYAEAADKLHLSQPALSLAIKSLEERIGGKLLTRTTRSFTLTPEGREFLPQAKILLRDWLSTIEMVKDRFALKTGQVSLAVMPSFAASLLPRVLKQFKDENPGISIVLQDVVAEEAVEMVRNEKVEMAISFQPHIMDDVSFKLLFHDQFIVALPADHPMTSQQSLVFERVLSEPLLVLQPPSQVTEIIMQAAHDKGLSCDSIMQAHQLATIGRMVSEGLGLSIVPKVCAKQMGEMGAICRPLVDVSIESNIGIITRKYSTLSAASLTFIDLLQKAFKDINLI